MSDTKLPEEILWAAGGHASDIALTALADGERAIVPDAVLAHVERCTACSAHLGNAALLSLHADREMAAFAAAVAPRPLPRVGIAIALLVAAVGAIPSLAPARVFATRDLPVFVKALGAIAKRIGEPGSPMGLALTYGGAALLLFVAFAAIRLLPKKETSQ